VVAVAYFAAMACLAVWHGLSPLQLSLAWALPLVLAAAARLETLHGVPWTRGLREWASLALILLAYWELQWFRTSYWEPWELRFESWDVALMAAWSPWLGEFPTTPSLFCVGLFQASYALLYALPPIYLGMIYAAGRRANTGPYLFTLFLGTFSAYFFLPHFPVRSPRMIFSYELVPAIVTIFGKWNVWVLDRFDISTSVFPSGHVAVAFSGAFGLLRALPGRKAIWIAAFGLALCIWAATIYSRLHYAADGAASFLISVAAWRVSGRWDRYDGVDS